MPRTLIEALMHSIPSVVTSVGGMPEIIEDGISGIIVPPADSVALTHAVRTLLLDTSLRSRIAAGGTTRVHTAFAHTTMVDKTEALYRNVIQRR